MTESQSRRIVEWAAPRLGLDAWGLELEITDEQPDWVGEGEAGGATYPKLAERTAKIWLSPAQCRKNGWNEGETLLHEVLHISFVEAGHDLPHNDYTEFIINRMAAAYWEAYRAKAKR